MYVIVVNFLVDNFPLELTFNLILFSSTSIIYNKHINTQNIYKRYIVLKCLYEILQVPTKFLV